MTIHIDMTARKTAPFPSDIRSRIEALANAHSAIARPEAIGRMIAADAGEDDALEADIAFHVAVLEASNNRFFRQFTDLTEGTLRFSIRRTNAYKGVPRASAADHKVVADAIIARDPPRARDEMFNLIEGALNLLLDAGKDPKRPA